MCAKLADQVLIPSKAELGAVQKGQKQEHLPDNLHTTDFPCTQPEIAQLQFLLHHLQNVNSV